MDLPDDPNKLTPAQWREIQAAVGPLAERNGLPPPRANVAPEVYCGAGSDLREIAMKLGDICRDQSKGLFMADKEIVTIDREKGTTEIMDADRFRSWIADHALIGAKWDKATGQLEKCTLGVEAARGVLKADHFRVKLPKLVAVNLVKQPVKRRDGRVELLPQGYDGESQVFTMEGGIDYPEDMPVEEAVAFLRSLFDTFPWGDDGRSLSVHIAAGLTLYCQNMLPPGTLTPMFIYNANMGGSGKSLLVSVFLWAMFGQAENMSIVEGHDEFKKELDTAAQALSPYVFFDDQDGYLENRLLNSWLTSRNWAGRILGSAKKFSMRKRAVTFLTGNMVSLSQFLARRSVVADLFSKQTLQDRTLPEETILITDEWMEAEENRKKVLAALWALVRFSCVPRDVTMRGAGDVEETLNICGRIDETWRRVRPKNRPLDSFETWSNIIPQIVVDAEFADPLERPDLPDAGDKGGREMDKMMKAIIRLHLWREVPKMGVAADGDVIELPEKERHALPSAKVELADMVRTARQLGLFSEIIDTTDLVLMELSRGRKGQGFWEDKFPKEGLLGGWEIRMPESEAEKRQQAECWYDKSMANKFSSRLKGKMGQYFTGECGGVYQLGERVATRVSTFLIKRI